MKHVCCHKVADMSSAEAAWFRFPISSVCVRFANSSDKVELYEFISISVC